MRLRREDLVERALELLGDLGLPDLTMRRLGSELGVSAGAIYHHFDNKQQLLGAVADLVIRRGHADEAPDDGPWRERAAQVCDRTRAAVLDYADGADLVATMWAFGLGGHAPYDVLRGLLHEAGLDPGMAATGARTLLHFVYGHAIDEQAHGQASRLGAIDDARDERGDDFADGLTLVLDGIAARVG